MIHLLHHSADINEVKKTIIPLLQGKEYSLETYPTGKDFHPEENAVLIAYLSDYHLREFLPKAAENNWQVGILPHPEVIYTIKGLGISEKTENAIAEILDPKEAYKLDLLFCNDKPVFQAVNIGVVFALTEERSKNSFLSEIYSFLRHLKGISSLGHKSFKLSIDDEQIIHTSALGIVVVEHASSSIVGRRLISESAANDGNFNALILAPQNIFDLLFFLFRSLAPRKTIKKVPEFIGQIKTSNLKIENLTEIEYIIDGEKATAKEIYFRVEHEALRLQQNSLYCVDEKEVKTKKSLKIDRLPTGEKRKELTQRKLPLLPRATTEEFEDLFTLLRKSAQVKSSYLVMMILSTLIATFGLFGDSSPVIIGAMILAPIITPIVAFSMGMVRYDVSMLKTGIKTILIGTIVSLLFAAVVSMIIPLQVMTSEIDARLSPTLLDMGIAVASGIAAAYAHAKKGIAKSLAGVAIAVALVPPLAVAGIGIGWWNWEVFSGAFLLYLTNLAGIIMFAGITFLLLGFAPFRRARMGLVYTSIIIMLVMVPLSLSFNRIEMEANITRQLEGTTVNEVILRDVKIRFGSPLMVSVKLVGPKSLESKEMEEIKLAIEEKINQEIILEVVSAIEF